MSDLSDAPPRWPSEAAWSRVARLEVGAEALREAFRPQARHYPERAAVDVEDASRLPAPEFARRYMLRNRPALLRGAAAGWRATREWVTADGRLDREAWRRLFGEARVCAARCWERSFSDQPREEVSLAEWLDRSGAGLPRAPGDPDPPALYVKDWHQARDFPGYGAYVVPPQVADDWLNAHWDARAAGLAAGRDQPPDDYRFVYAGPRGTWTPLHRDVFCSYSWSVNVLGRKRWYLFPPDAEPLLVRRDLGGRCVFDVLRPDGDEARLFPGLAAAMRRCAVLDQGPGELVFVPAGWYHQVHNLEDTVSVNHNWFNAFSLDLVGRHVLDELEAARQALSGYTFGRPGPPPPPPPDQDCQAVMKASAGIDLPEWCALLADRQAAELGRLERHAESRDRGAAYEAAAALLGASRAAALLHGLYCGKPWLRGVVAPEALSAERLRGPLRLWLWPWARVAPFLSPGDAESLRRALRP